MLRTIIFATTVLGVRQDSGPIMDWMRAVYAMEETQPALVVTE